MSVSIPTAGGSATLTFTGGASQRVSVWAAQSTIASYVVRIVRPDSTTLATSVPLGSGSNYAIDATTLPTSGTYTLVVTPRLQYTGSVTITLYDVPPDVDGTIAAGGSAVTVSATVPGQNARLAFEASAGQRVSVSASAGTIASYVVAIVEPDGTTLKTSPPIGVGSSYALDTTELGTDGTYTLLVNPRYEKTGGVTMTLHAVPPEAGGAMDVGGPPLSLVISTPGQNGLVSVGGTAGQGIRLTVSGAGSKISILDPDLDYLVTPGPLYGGQGSGISASLPSTGTYTIVVDPYLGNTGTITLALSGSPGSAEAPAIFGLDNVDEQLTASPGSWSPSPSSAAYQWLRCNRSGGSCVALFGVTDLSYSPTYADIGSTLRLRVSASNGFGTTTALSRRTLIVLAPLAELALDYRPWLLFNGGAADGRFERWRPIEITSFLSETSPENEICFHPAGDYAVGTCTGMSGETGANGLLSTDTDDSFVDIAGDGPEEYHAPPNGPCSLAGGLQDCNEGPSSAIYFEPGQDLAEYRYLDFWWFLRFNDVTGDGHEGDWEGVTVVLDPVEDPSRPDLVAFVVAAHDARPWYLAHELELVGLHGMIYSAEDSHASYPSACPSLSEPVCLTPDYLSEHPHDGSSAWGNDNDVVCNSSCVRRFPASGWASWLGRWGASVNEAIEAPVGWSPRSPSRQQRFQCAQNGYSSGGCSRFPGSRTPLSTRRRSRTPAAQLCRSWLGAHVAALACDARELAATVRNHRLTRRGSLHLFVRGYRSADVPGLAQVLGSPLRPGRTLVVIGRASQRTVLILQLEKNHHFYRATIPFTRLHHRQRSVIHIRDTRTTRPSIDVNGRVLAVRFQRLR